MKVIKEIIKFWLKLDKKPVIILLAFILQFAFPQVSGAEAIKRYDSAAVAVEVIGVGWPTCWVKDGCIERQFLSPTVDSREPIKTFYIIVTAYSSTPDQTDSTPCITASGLDVCERNKEDIVALNFLPMGTKVRFPEEFGEKVFIVHDRMNPRYHYHADIWMKSREDAINFGAKYLKIEIF